MPCGAALRVSESVIVGGRWENRIGAITINPSSPATDPAEERSNRATFAFLAISAFINSTGVGLTAPVMPTLLMELSGGDLAGASAWGGLALVVYAIMQFIFAPIVGALSDRYGRRPVLLISLAAFAVDMFILGIVGTLWGFIVLRAFAGIFSSTFSTINAYVSDVTPAKERGTRFAMLGASFGAGFIFGPAIGGLLGSIDVRLPFYAGAAVAMGNVAFGYFVVRESLPTSRRRAFSWARANTFGTLLRLFRTPGVGPLLPVFFLATLSSWVYPTVWSYVAIEKFAWSEANVGFSIAYYGVIAFIAQALVVQILLPRMGVRAAIVLALAVEVVALAGIGVASTGMFVYAMVTLALISIMQDPALRQDMSARVAEDAQGELQGGLSALVSVAMVVSPVIYMGLFTFNADDTGVYFPGSPFVAAAVFSLVAMVSYLLASRHYKTHAAEADS